jgi:hypothetical protein
MRTLTIGELPQEANLLVYKGDDIFVTVTVLTPTGEPEDLSSSVIIAQIRETPESDEVVAVFDVEIEGHVIYLHLTNAESTKVTEQGVWDCQEDDLGIITTFARGKVIPTWDVSRV